MRMVEKSNKKLDSFQSDPSLSILIKTELEEAYNLKKKHSDFPIIRDPGQQPSSTNPHESLLGCALTVLTSLRQEVCFSTSVTV